MSRNPSKLLRKNAAPRKGDQRVVRTRDVLGDALVQLMREKRFEEITVQQVLDRAGVSRSTFYTHYSDKNDLFLGDVEDFWEGMSTLLERRGEVSHRVAPVRELFAHVAEQREFHAALVASGKVREVMELGQGQFARAIERKLKELPQARAIKCEHHAALAQMFAGALFSSLTWWVSRGSPLPATQVDDLYHQMVWSGINGYRS